MQADILFRSTATRASLGRYATVETAELRIPLECGWKRETLVREYSKSGVRGDVVYYAPCGKKFKQYPDIVRVSGRCSHFLHFCSCLFCKCHLCGMPCLTRRCLVSRSIVGFVYQDRPWHFN